MNIGVIFDLDGTLLDTLTDLADAVNETLRHYGCPEHSYRQIRAMVGNGVRNLILAALPEEKKGTVDAILPWFRSYYAAHSQEKTCPYPGILEALEQLRREFPVAVVSNKPDAVVKPLCREFFGDLYALGEAADLPRKPAPDMVFRAMEALGVEKCIYVGDSEVDIQTAANSGVPCLSVLWGFRDREVLEAAGANCFCRTPDRLPDCIRQIAAGI